MNRFYYYCNTWSRFYEVWDRELEPEDVKIAEFRFRADALAYIERRTTGGGVRERDGRTGQRDHQQ